MELVDCLDLGAALVPTAACLVAESSTLSYAEVQGLSRSVAASLAAQGVGPGCRVALLSGNDPLALTCILGASRTGAAWTLLDPADLTVDELVSELGACSVLLFRTTARELARELCPQLPQAPVLVCLDGPLVDGLGWGEFLASGLDRTARVPVGPPRRRPAEPAEDRPVFLALGPLSEATASRWQRVLAQGGRIVMRTAEAAPSETPRLEA